MLNIDEIRARCEVATPEPWNRHDKDDYAEIHNSDTWGKFFSPIALVEYDKDADFIAHARTDIPALIAEVERLQKELDKYKSHSECISALPDCNTCAIKNCEVRPKPGDWVRINCHLWRGAQEGR